MADLKNPGLTTLSGLVDKIALEVLFAESGKDNGLLPINSLLSDLEAAVVQKPPPAPIVESLAAARRVIDTVFEVGTFEPGNLSLLKGWTAWMENALVAADQNRPLPPLPNLDLEASEEAPAEMTLPSTAAESALEDPLTLNLEGDAELLSEFVSESQEHLQNIELGVLALEEDPTDADTLNSIFRAFHTFKGGSGFLNLVPINKLAHELESLLDLARQQKLTIDSEVTNIILTGGDTLNQFVQAIEVQLKGFRPPGETWIPIQPLLARVRAVIEGASSRPSAELPTLSVTPVNVDPAVVSRSSSAERPVALPPADAEPPKTVSDVPRKLAGASVKVDTDKLDSLVDLVGEMVIAQSMVAQDPDLVALQSERLTRNFAQLTRITRDLQRVSMSLRMVPIRGLFQKMNRVVRDLAVKAGKQVQLQMEGEETELDRTIVEEINDPLVHMIRNSMDHGVEKAEARLAAGKSPYGIVTLRAFHQGGNIVIEVRDDGAGLNRERLLKKAIERGLARAGEDYTDKEIFGFIFAAGFSTAEKVTDISGRGVGMDVVRRNIEKLRGKIEVDSESGKGTKISIHLPLTLAIIDGLIVMVAGERYIVPTLSVRESFRPTDAMLSTVHERGELINVRGHLMPLLRLHELFGRFGAVTKPSEGILLVVESDTRVCCLLVDQLIGKQEVVIKSLGDTFKRNPGLAGAAILGDGRVGLILDIAGLMVLQAQPVAEAA